MEPNRSGARDHARGGAQDAGGSAGAAPLSTEGEVRAMVREEVAHIESLQSLRSVRPAVLGRPWWVALPVVLAVILGLVGMVLPRRANPTPAYLIDMAALHLVTGNAEVALLRLEEAVESPRLRDPGTLALAGELYRRLGQFDRAIDLLERAVRRDGNRTSYRLSLARSYAGAGADEEAVSQYEQLCLLEPETWLFHIELGDSLEALGEYGRAVAEYNRVVELAPDVVDGYLRLGQLYRTRLEEYALAAEQYGLALEIEPAHYLATVYYGASLAGQGDYQAAIAQYTLALEIYPQGESAPYFLGETYRLMKQLEPAIEWYTRALERKADSQPALLGLGSAYLEAGDCPKASEQFRKLLKLQPDNLDARIGLDACRTR